METSINTKRPYILVKNHEDHIQKRGQLKGLGGSDVGIAMGLSPFTTPYELWEEKYLGKKREIKSEPAEIGIRIEEFIAQLYMERSSHRVFRDRKIRFHPDKPFMYCALDRVIVGVGRKTPGDLECKNVSGFIHWDSAVPTFYYSQFQHQLAVTGWEWGEFAILKGGNHFTSEPIERDESYIKTLIEFEEYWWNHHVVQGIPPEKEFKDFEVTTPLPGKTIEANCEDPEIQKLKTLAVELKTVRESKSIAEKKEKELKAIIGKLIGDAEFVTFNGQQILSWKEQKTNRLDTEKLQAEMPDIYTQFLSENKFRVLRTK